MHEIKASPCAEEEIRLRIPGKIKKVFPWKQTETSRLPKKSGSVQASPIFLEGGTVSGPAFPGNTFFIYPCATGRKIPAPHSGKIKKYSRKQTEIVRFPKKIRGC
jgi:hypothetical protein